MARAAWGWVAAALACAPAANADPSKQECVDAGSQAQDLKDKGKLTAARQQALVCVSASCGAMRDDCAKLLDDIERALPNIVFDAKDGDGNDLSAVRVTMDGAVLVERLDGKALALDPGEHAFHFEGNGAALDKTFIIHEAEKGRREKIVLGKPTAPPPAPPPPVVPASPVVIPPVPLPPSAAPPPPGLGAQRIAAIVLGSLSAVPLALGALFGAGAAADWGAVVDTCPNVKTDARCATRLPNGDAPGSRAQHALHEANFATAMFVVGGAMLGTSIIVGVTAPSRTPPATVGVTLAPNGLALVGAF